MQITREKGAPGKKYTMEMWGLSGDARLPAVQDIIYP